MKRYVKADSFAPKGSGKSASTAKGLYKLDNSTLIPLNYGYSFYCYPKLLFDVNTKKIELSISVYICPPYEGKLDKFVTNRVTLNSYTEDEFLNLYDRLMSLSKEELDELFSKS